MTARTPLYFVCSPQPRVGRTLLARMLVDFFLLDDRPVAAFDFAVDSPRLADFFPPETRAADVATIAGQMAVFDRLILNDGIAKVVDVSPAAFQTFFTVLREIDFIADARARGIKPVALFIATPEVAAQRAYATLQGRLPEMLLVPVYNQGAGQGPKPEKFPLARADSLPLRIPQLGPALQPFLRQPPFSFFRFRTRAPREIPLQAYLELLRWNRRVFVEFRELELRLLLGEVRASLLRGAS
jgi:hypothetical protein